MLHIQFSSKKLYKVVLNEASRRDRFILAETASDTRTDANVIPP
jgi:hypothetical protein